jgi:CheY-like chemotaxis protein
MSRQPLILVIDDESSVLELLHEILIRHQYAVQTAIGGQDGLNRFKAQTPDLVITDIAMPHIDGNQVAACIKTASHGGIPVIGMTGDPEKIVFQNLDVVLFKPFKLANLIHHIERLLEKYELFSPIRGNLSASLR